MWLLLLACHPCTLTDWDDLAVRIDAGVDEDTLDGLLRVLDQFIGWSGREQSCVRTLTVRSDYDLVREGYGAGGSYRSTTGELQVSTAFEDPETALLHELCHATWQQDRAWREDRELFPRGSLDRGDGKGADREEVFALTCEVGPQQALRQAWVQEQCGVGVTDRDPASLQRVQEAVYGEAAAGADWGPAGEPAPVGPTWTVSEPEPDLQLTGVDAGLDHVVVAWSSRAEEGRVIVEHRAPQDGAVAIRHELQACGPAPYLCLVSLLAGPDGPWLFADGGTQVEEQRLWQLLPTGPVEHPTLCEQGDGEVVVDGTMWELAWNWREDDGGREVTGLWVDGCRVDSGQAVREILPMPAFPLRGWRLTWTEPTLTWVGQDLAAWWPDAGLSGSGEQGWAEQELPPHLDLAGVAPGPDGELGFLVQTEDLDGGHTLGLSTLWPAAGTWEAPTPTCEVLPAPIETDDTWAATGEVEARLLRGRGWGALARRAPGEQEWNVTVAALR